MGPLLASPVESRPRREPAGSFRKDWPVNPTPATQWMRLVSVGPSSADSATTIARPSHRDSRRVPATRSTAAKHGPGAVVMGRPSTSPAQRATLQRSGAGSMPTAANTDSTALCRTMIPLTCSPKAPGTSLRRVCVRAAPAWQRKRAPPARPAHSNCGSSRLCRQAALRPRVQAHGFRNELPVERSR